MRAADVMFTLPYCSRRGSATGMLALIGGVDARQSRREPLATEKRGNGSSLLGNVTNALA